MCRSVAELSDAITAEKSTPEEIGDIDAELGGPTRTTTPSTLPRAWLCNDAGRGETTDLHNLAGVADSYVCIDIAPIAAELNPLVRFVA